MHPLAKLLEAALFAASRPLTLEELSSLAPGENIQPALDEVRALYQGDHGVELEKFSGPLDLLLHLIREDEVDITDLPIA